MSPSDFAANLACGPHRVLWHGRRVHCTCSPMRGEATLRKQSLGNSEINGIASGDVSSNASTGGELTGHAKSGNGVVQSSNEEFLEIAGVDEHESITSEIAEDNGSHIRADMVKEQQGAVQAVEGHCSLPCREPGARRNQNLAHACSMHESEGLLIALVAVLSGMVGRMSAQQVRFDAARLFRYQESSRALSLELRRKRELWKQEETARMAEDQRRKVEQVTKKALQEAEQQQRLQEKYEKEARQEAERQMAKVEASRKAYEEQQKALEAEYEERLKKEKEAIEEARRKEQERREEEERKREMELRKREEQRRLREEEERKAREAAAVARAAARKAAKKEMSKFAVRVEGQVAVSIPPEGTLVPGPLQEEAKVRITLQVGSLLSGGQGPTRYFDYTSIDEAEVNIVREIPSAIRNCTDNIYSALQLQGMSGEGAISLMEKPEIDLWMYCITGRTSLKALDALNIAVRAFKKMQRKDLDTEFEESFQCRTESGVLPPEHPQSAQNALSSLLADIIENPGGLNAVESFREVLQEQNESFYQDLGVVDQLKDAPACLGSCLEVAHFVDRSLYARPAKQSGAPAWFELCAQFCRKCLNDMLGDAPEDSLHNFAALATAALGSEHPVAIEISSINDRRTSSGYKLTVAERENAKQRLLAAKLLEQEWPDEEDIRRARMQDKEAKTPVAERIWALRNVAGTLSMGSTGEKSRARQLLEQAVLLKQQVCGSQAHPAVFPEACALFKVVKEREEWREDATGLASLLLRIIYNISIGYVDIGDGCSAVITLEFGLREYEDIAGLKKPATLKCVRTLEKVSASLSSDDHKIVAEWRKKSGQIESLLSKSFTDELGAYQVGTELDQYSKWEARGAVMLPKMSDI